MLKREKFLVRLEWWQKENKLKGPLEVSEIWGFDQEGQEGKEGQEAHEDYEGFFQEIENQDEL